MNNYSGLNLQNLFMIIISFILILIINKKTHSESAVLLIGILIFHHIVAYLYAFVLSMPENEVDSIGFLGLAAECKNYGHCGYLGQYLYGNYLSKVLAIGGSIYSVFLLNVLFFVISLYFFIKIAELIFNKSNRKTIIVLYGLWPSVIFFTTLSYREPFELYFLIAATYFGLTGSQTDNFFKMFVSMILLLIMGMFHIKGLIFLSPILFLILVSYRTSLSIPSLVKRVVILSILVVPVYFSQEMYFDYIHEVSVSKNARSLVKIDIGSEKLLNKTVKKSLSKEFLLMKKNRYLYYNEKKYPDTAPSFIDSFMRKVAYYRASLSWIRVPKSAFISEISDKNIPVFLATYSLVYLEYLFSPFIFQVNSFPVLLAYLESILRLILFVSALLYIRHKPSAAIFLFLYMAVTAMWALGVISFGASIRHHVQTNWILVLLGVPVISDYIRERFKTRRIQS